jgi:hypothetical protein
MELKKFVVGTAMALAISAGQARADKVVPLWEKDPQQQYDATRNDLSYALMVIDQYGDTKLKRDVGETSAYWGYVDRCGTTLSHAEHVEQAILWSICGDDIKSVDESKLKREDNKQHVAEWKKLGVALEAEAKDDAGIALILAQTAAAKEDWKVFEAQNHDAIALYQKLKDGMRTSKSNDKNLDGCWELTQPAFAKAVKATKFAWGSQTESPADNAIAPRIRAVIAASPANYYAVANFGMCATAGHVTGGMLASAAFATKGAIFGWRTLLVTKYLDAKLKPKFSDRSYKWAPSRTAGQLVGWNERTEDKVAWPGGPGYVETGVVKSMKNDGDDTVVKFSGTIINDCLEWKETNRLRGWDSAGQPMYEEKCLRRGRKESDAPHDATMSSKLLDGVKPGMGVALWGWFPVEVYSDKTHKFISVLGVPVKGSPAETPLKE